MTLRDSQYLSEYIRGGRGEWGGGEGRGWGACHARLTGLWISIRDYVNWFLLFAHGAMGRRIDPSWGGPIELFLVPASAPRLV